MCWLTDLFKKKSDPNMEPVPAAPTIPSNDPHEIELPSAKKAIKPKLGIVVGHTRLSSGACLANPYGTSEYEFNTGVADMIKRYALSRWMEVGVYFRDKGGIAGAYADAIKGGSDAVIELHFNAFNAKATGTATLCTSDPKDKAFADIVHTAMCEVFGRNGKSRGVQVISRNDRGGGNVHAFPVGPNCLVEPVFGDEPTEAKMLVELKDKYAKCLVDAFEKWCRDNGLLHS